MHNMEVFALFLAEISYLDVFSDSAEQFLLGLNDLQSFQNYKKVPRDLS